MVAAQESVYIGKTAITYIKKKHVKFHALIHQEEHKYKVSIKCLF